MAKNPNQTTFDSNTVVQLTATPAVGYSFTGWSGGATGTTNPVSVTMNAAKSVTATFAIKTYALTITSVNGTVVKNPNQATFDSNTVVQLTATPNTGYVFNGWSGDTTSTANPISITMKSAKNITANFGLKSYTLTITSAHGTVVKSPNLSLYDSNSVVGLKATPAAGYTFTGWTGDVVSASDTITVTMNAAKNLTANYTIKTYALTVTAVNGTVAKSPDQPLYDSNTVVSLTATPAAGYTFTGWSGAATGTTNPISVTMNAAKSVTATFAIKTYALTITAVNGTVAKSPDLASYDSNAVVQLTATPAAGYTFTGWSGGATGTTNPISVTMNAAKSVTATFAIKTYALTITAVNGTVAKNPNQASFDSNTVVQLTATPNTGYVFNGWSGDTTSTANPISVTMKSAKNITANFGLKSYTLTITSAHGTVVKSPNLSLYDSNSVVGLKVTPAAGYTFTGWTGDVISASDTITVTMNAAKNLTANYTIKTYALTVTAVNGTVAKSPDLASYDSNAVVQLTATPAAGYTFTGWSGGATGTTNPVSVTMNAAKSVTATFAIKAYALTITAVNGTVAKSPNQATFDSNSVVQLTATPNAGYTFTGWTGDTTVTANPISVTMKSAKNITANFAIKVYALTITAVNGTVAKSPNQATFDSNSVVQLTATPNAGYTFTGWTGDTTVTANPISVTMKSAKNITANFVIKTYALTITAVNGTVAKNPNQTTFDSNTVVQLTATPATGYTFTGWSGAATGTTNPVSVTMNAAKSVTATFAIKTYALTITAVNGTVVKNPNQATFDSNTVVQLTATPNTGYTFTGWTGDTTVTANPISVTMKSAKNITANFVIKTYALTITAVNGTVAKNPNQAIFDSNTVVQLTATPNTGYTFTGWTGDTTVTANPISVTMKSAKNITANFIASVHNYPIASGWNIVSFNVLPLDSAAVTIFGSMSHLVIAKNSAGDVYWPSFSINNIVTIHVNQGYMVYTTAADTIRITGTPIAVATSPIALSAGWNIMGYSPQVDLPIATALAGIASQITIVKNTAGDVYWPDFGINNIVTMHVGEGYFIHMKADASLTYPSGLGKMVSVASGMMLPKTRHFVYASGNTGNSATMLLKNVVENTKAIPDSSEIAVYDASGILVGSGTVMSGKSAFSIWGDNEMTKEKDGLGAAEALTFKVWTPTNEEYAGTYVGPNSSGYTENALMIGALSIHRAMKITNCALATAYPNPFRGNVRIAFDVAAITGKDMANVEINVYDVRGVLVRQLTKGLYKTGRYSVTWDGSDHIGSNMYIVMMKTEKLQPEDETV